MAGKGKKKKDATGGNKEKKKGGKKKTGRTAGSGKSSRIQGDIFSDGAMENAYLLCHNVQVCHQQQEVLKVRGFPWPDGKSKGKKKRK